MTEQPPAELAEIDREPVPAWWRHFVPGWFTLIALGFLLYELTHWPALGVLAACCKFGFNDWRAAFWLLRRDPNRGRGRAAFWLYLASGLWKTALMGVLVFFVLLVAVEIASRAGGAARGAVARLARAELQGAVTVAVCAFGLTVFAATLAVALARWYGVRLWLNGRMAEAARRGVWPPSPAGGSNHGIWLSWTVLLLALIALTVVLGVAAIILVRRFGRAGVGFLGLAFFGAVAVLFAWRKRLAELTLADSPEACWGPTDDRPDESARE